MHNYCLICSVGITDSLAYSQFLSRFLVVRNKLWIRTFCFIIFHKQFDQTNVKHEGFPRNRIVQTISNDNCQRAIESERRIDEKEVEADEFSMINLLSIDWIM